MQQRAFFPSNQVTVIDLSSINMVAKDDTINGIFNLRKKQQTTNDYNH